MLPQHFLCRLHVLPAFSNLNPASDEVLFEIYDAGEDGIILDEPKFLGLAIVGLSELKQAPEPVHHLRLQGRPYKNDNVSGVLTIEVGMAKKGIMHKVKKIGFVFKKQVK